MEKTKKILVEKLKAVYDDRGFILGEIKSTRREPRFHLTNGKISYAVGVFHPPARVDLVKKPLPKKWFFGVPDWSRTSDLQSRSLTLYPTELQAQI